VARKERRDGARAELMRRPDAADTSPIRTNAFAVVASTSQSMIRHKDILIDDHDACLFVNVIIVDAARVLRKSAVERASCAESV